METIETVDSPLPDKINNLKELEIRQPCRVDRAYQLVEDYPNLRQLKIAGSLHTRQEIKQLPFGGMIGSRVLEFNTIPAAPPAIQPPTIQDFQTWANQVPARPTPEELTRIFTGTGTEPIVEWGTTTHLEAGIGGTDVGNTP